VSRAHRNIDLNRQHPRDDELDLLNAAGTQGWQLVGIRSNGIAYLKREVVELVPTGLTPTAQYAGNRRQRRERTTSRGESEVPRPQHE
jgi:hypothetical protein